MHASIYCKLPLSMITHRIIAIRRPYDASLSQVRRYFTVCCDIPSNILRLIFNDCIGRVNESGDDGGQWTWRWGTLRMAISIKSLGFAIFGPGRRNASAIILFAAIRTVDSLT